MRRGFCKAASLVSLHLKRGFSASPVTPEDQFKLDSCQMLMNGMSSRLLESAKTKTSGTAYPRPTPNVEVVCRLLRSKEVHVWTAYSAASVLKHNKKPQPVMDAAIATLVCRYGIPQAAMIAAFSGNVVSSLAELFGVGKSNDLLDIFGVAEDAEVVTDAQSVSTGLNDAIFRLKNRIKVPKRVPREVKIVAARMMNSGRSIRFLEGVENVIPHFMSDFAQVKICLVR